MVLDIMNYDISNGYTIEDIKCIKDDIYSFNITTLKPSPGILELKYSQEIPSWVSLSDFQGLEFQNLTKHWELKHLYVVHMTHLIHQKKIVSYFHQVLQ